MKERNESSELGILEQSASAAKWELAQRMIPILESTFRTITDISYSPERWDYLMDVIENYLPRAVARSELPERLQEEILEQLSALSRARTTLINRRRQKQMLGLIVSFHEFQERILGFLLVEKHRGKGD
jgi:RimJ/RimL family protein N-acetyltransferase